MLGGQQDEDPQAPLSLTIHQALTIGYCREKMMNVERIKKKLKQSGIRGLSAAALRHAASLIDSEPKASYDKSNYISHQVSAHRVLSRYASFEGKEVLEVGGAQSCDSIYPFLKDGAANAIVTGLNHISLEQTSNDYNLRVLRADALKLSGCKRGRYPLILEFGNIKIMHLYK